MRILLFSPTKIGTQAADRLRRRGHQVCLVHSDAWTPDEEAPATGESLVHDQLDAIRHEALRCDLAAFVVTDEPEECGGLVPWIVDVGGVICLVSNGCARLVPRADASTPPSPPVQYETDHIVDSIDGSTQTSLDWIGRHATAVITPSVETAAALRPTCAGPVVIGPVPRPDTVTELDDALDALLDVAAEHARIRPVLDALRASVAHIGIWQGDRTVVSFTEHWEPLRIFRAALTRNRSDGDR